MKLLLDIAIPAITFVLLGAVGLDLRVEDFRRVARQPGVMLAGLLGPVLLLPLLALGLLALFRPWPAIAAGLLLIVASGVRLDLSQVESDPTEIHLSHAVG